MHRTMSLLPLYRAPLQALGAAAAVTAAAAGMAEGLGATAAGAAEGLGAAEVGTAAIAFLI